MSKKDYRIHDWLRLSTLETVYGIQKRVAPRKWMNCCVGDKPLFFKIRANASQYMDALVARDNGEDIPLPDIIDVIEDCSP